MTDLRSSPLTEYADHVVIAPIEGAQGSVSHTAMVAAVQAIIAELMDADARRAVGRAEEAWNRLDLLDDQP